MNRLVATAIEAQKLNALGIPVLHFLQSEARTDAEFKELKGLFKRACDAANSDLFWSESLCALCNIAKWDVRVKDIDIPLPLSLREETK